MNDRLLDRIPDHLHGAVSAALSAAFGTGGMLRGCPPDWGSTDFHGMGHETSG